MKKVIEDLIERLQEEKKENEKKIIELKSEKEDLLIFLFTGKILAYDYCISELKRAIDYSNVNEKKVNFRK